VCNECVQKKWADNDLLLNMIHLSGVRELGRTDISFIFLSTTYSSSILHNTLHIFEQEDKIEDHFSDLCTSVPWLTMYKICMLQKAESTS
jgi:hypothetical protein